MLCTVNEVVRKLTKNTVTRMLAYHGQAVEKSNECVYLLRQNTGIHNDRQGVGEYNVPIKMQAADYFILCIFTTKLKLGLYLYLAGWHSEQFEDVLSVSF